MLCNTLVLPSRRIVKVAKLLADMPYQIRVDHPPRNLYRVNERNMIRATVALNHGATQPQ